MSSKKSHVQINTVNGFIPGWEWQALTSWLVYRENDRVAIEKDQSILWNLPCWAAGGGGCVLRGCWEAWRELWALSSTAHNFSDHHNGSRAGADIINSRFSGIFSPSPSRNFRTVARDWCKHPPCWTAARSRWALLSPSLACV